MCNQMLTVTVNAPKNRVISDCQQVFIVKGLIDRAIVTHIDFNLQPVFDLWNQKPINWLGQKKKRRANKVRPKAVEYSILGSTSNFHKCRQEVAGVVISGVAVD